MDDFLTLRTNPFQNNRAFNFDNKTKGLGRWATQVILSCETLSILKDPQQPFDCLSKIKSVWHVIRTVGTTSDATDGQGVL